MNLVLPNMELNPTELELVRKYALGKLPPEEAAGFSERLASDGDFRKEVEFHRQLVAGLKDRDAARLKKMLQQEEAEHYPPKKPGANKPDKWILGMLALALTTGLCYFLNKESRAAEPSGPPPPVENPAPQPPPKSEPPAPENTPAPPAENRPGKPKISQKPIASAEALAPNPSWEALITSQLRGAPGSFSCEMPKNGTVFFIEKNGAATIRFVGSFGPEDAENAALALSVFNNRDQKPLFSANAPVQVSGGKLAFDFTQKRALAPGLYYFSFENKGDGGMVWVGRFLVE